MTALTIKPLQCPVAHFRVFTNRSEPQLHSSSDLLLDTESASRKYLETKIVENAQ